MSAHPDWARPVAVGGVELWAEGFGDPEAPPLLLLSGAAASLDWWDPALCRLIASGGRHVVRYDHRDTGQSSTGTPGEPGYGGGVLEQDAVGLIEALDLGPVDLVGLSMGGGIAQSIALRRPELVATLTLVATTAVGGLEEVDLPGPVAALAATFEDPPADPDWSDREAVIDWIVEGERPFVGGGAFDEEGSRETAGRVLDRSIDPAAAGNHWLAVSRDDGDDGEQAEPLDVHRISLPTLVVHGIHDPLFPLPHGEALAAAVPGARLLRVEAMGHQVPPRHAWSAFSEAVLALRESG